MKFQFELYPAVIVSNIKLGDKDLADVLAHSYLVTDLESLVSTSNLFLVKEGPRKDAYLVNGAVVTKGRLVNYINGHVSREKLVSQRIKILNYFKN